MFMSDNETEKKTPVVVEETEVKEDTTVGQSTIEASTGISMMKIYIGAILLVAVVLLGVLFKLEKEGRSSTNIFGTIIASQEANRSVAVVNGTDIKNEDLTKSIEQFMELARAQGVDTSKEETMVAVRTQALEVLINTELLRQSAIEKGLSVTDEEVDERIENIKEELGGEEVLNERMATLGMEADNLREDIKEELLIQALLDQVFAEEAIEVTEEEVMAVYDGAGGEEAGLPPLEAVRDQIETQVVTTKEQEIVDELIQTLKEEGEVEIN